MLDWKTEEKVLLDIKRIIAVVWRMNQEQLSHYYKKLQKNADAALPGRIGHAFLDTIKHMSAYPADTQTKAWTELMHDADRLLDLIHRQGSLDAAAWHAALQKLESQPDRSFRTELGRSFILALKEKLGIDVPKEQISRSSQKELEKIASWLMQDSQDTAIHPKSIQIHPDRKPDKKRTIFSSGNMQKAAVLYGHLAARTGGEKPKPLESAANEAISSQRSGCFHGRTSAGTGRCSRSAKKQSPGTNRRLYKERFPNRYPDKNSARKP